MKHRIPIIALSLLMTSCLRAEPTTKPATQPGADLGNLKERIEVLAKDLQSKDQALWSLRKMVWEYKGENTAVFAPVVDPLLSMVGWGGIANKNAYAAAEILAKIGAVSRPKLLAALKSPEARLRRAAASILVRIGPKDASLARAISPLLSDKDEYVCRVACQCLGRLGAAARCVAPLLVKSLENASPYHVIDGHLALARITGRTQADIEAISPFLNHATPDVRRFAAETIKQIRTIPQPTTKPVVRKSRQITCRGKVVDAEGKPLAGATVQAYECIHKKSEVLATRQLRGEMTTKADGAFSFEWTCDDWPYAQGVIVARKGDLAFDWNNWRRRADKPTRLLAMTLRLGRPMILAGVVVGESGQPVAGARVRAGLRVKGKRKRFHKTISGSKVLNRLITRTDSRGRFKFAGIPKDTLATFTVSAPGYAEISVPKRLAIWPPPAGSDKPYPAGRKNIKITLPLKATIEGVVIDKATRKPVSNVALAARLEIRRSTCVSGKDGRFSFKGMVPGRHIIELARPRMGAAEWVTEIVTVTTEAGKTTGNVTIELSKGGLVEVTVTDEADNKPLPGADVALSALPTRQYHGGWTNKKGVARIRLLPGTHRLKTVFKQGYIHSYPDKSVEVTEGKTLRLSVQLKAHSKIRVVVVDQAGKTVTGARVHVMPNGGKATTDEDGKAEVVARINPCHGEPKPKLVVVIRHAHRNLAAAEDIEDESKPVNVKLQQGTTLVGLVTGPGGRPIPGARISLMLQLGSRISMWIVPLWLEQRVTDALGRYEIKAVPHGQKYTVQAEADGFGRAKVKVELDDDKTGRAKVKTIVLQPANLSISGVVVNADGKPVPDVRVSAFNDDQLHRAATTDKEGKFVIKHVTASKFRVYTSVCVSNKRHYGEVIAKGGDKDIKVVLGQYPGSHPQPTSRPTTSTKSTTTTSAPAVDPKVMAILKRLEAAGDKYPNITAKIDYKVDMLQTGDTESRTGRVYYQGPGKKTPAKFRIHFDTLRQGSGPKIKDVVDYAFDGAWLTVRKERIKQMSRYQVAPPGKKVNPLQLGKGPFPVPFGQKADAVIKHFRSKTRPDAKTDPKDTDYIKLTTRRRYRKEFSVVWLEMWVSRKTSLPVKIVAEDRSENQTTVIFKDTQTPKSFPKKTFTLPRPPAGWEYHVEKYKGQVKP